MLISCRNILMIGSMIVALIIMMYLYVYIGTYFWVYNSILNLYMSCISLAVVWRTSMNWLLIFVLHWLSKFPPKLNCKLFYHSIERYRKFSRQFLSFLDRVVTICFLPLTFVPKCHNLFYSTDVAHIICSLVVCGGISVNMLLHILELKSPQFCYCITTTM